MPPHRGPETQTAPALGLVAEKKEAKFHSARTRPQQKAASKAGIALADELVVELGKAILGGAQRRPPQQVALSTKAVQSIGPTLVVAFLGAGAISTAGPVMET
mmetsp:Transcript_36601/g.100732  ORF Transcript_36601/g.100732 Transcript_36601/m.100732 type:complete len:103 (+) Transcript_36601:298-606(+)